MSGKRVSVLAQGQIQPLGVAVTRDGHIAVTDCQGKRVRVSEELSIGSVDPSVGSGRVDNRSMKFCA